MPRSLRRGIFPSNRLQAEARTNGFCLSLSLLLPVTCYLSLEFPMLSLQFIRENADAVRKAVRDRDTEAPIDRILELDGLRREYVQQADELKAQRNNLGREIGRADPAERQLLLDRGKSLSTAIDTFDQKL